MGRFHKQTLLFSLFIQFIWISCCSGEEPHALFLTWKKDPTKTMTIQWISSKEATLDTVEYRKLEPDNQQKPWLKSDGSHHILPQDVPYLMHVTEIQSLEPNTSYQFRLSMSDQEYLFRTMPSTLKEPISFLVGGDTNNCGIELFEDTNRAASKHEPFFVVFGGDLAYAAPKNKNEQEDSKLWLDWIRSYFKTMVSPSGHLIPLLVTVGNHDVKGHYKGNPQDAPFFYSLFAMPGLPGYNVLRFCDYLSFYLLDSNHTNRIKGPQTKWLAEQLESDAKNNIAHRFAIYHVPAFPSVRQYRKYESASIRKHWVPLFEKYGLQIAFENNDHAYKRTYPLLQEKVNPQGIVYIGDGSWGTKPRIPKKAKETHYLAKTRAVRQFLKVILTDNSREFWSIAPDGEVIDHYIQLSVNIQEKMLPEASQQ